MVDKITVKNSGPILVESGPEDVDGGETTGVKMKTVRGQESRTTSFSLEDFCTSNRHREDTK